VPVDHRTVFSAQAHGKLILLKQNQQITLNPEKQLHSSRRVLLMIRNEINNEGKGIMNDFKLSA
jgi:hypothetical protein